MGASARQACRLDGLRVLLVEDDADLREGMTDALEIEGASVVTADTGNAGFRAFASERPDVLVSDLWMPDGSGFELIARIRALPPEQGGLVPAIAISAGENMRTALMAGFHVFAAKPFDWNKLVDILADFALPEGKGQAAAPWTITVRRPGQLCIRFRGRMDPEDMRAMTKALLVHLEAGAVEIITDLRQLTGFSPSVASLAERAVWAWRRNILAVCVIGGSFSARLVCAAACKILGVPCSFADATEGERRIEP